MYNRQTMSCEDLCTGSEVVYIRVAQGSGPCSCIRVAITTREISTVTLKAIPTTATALGSVGDTSIANTDSQVVTMGQLQQIVNQLTSNKQALENKISEIGIFKIKMLLVKRFSGEKAKFKGFLT